MGRHRHQVYPGAIAANPTDTISISASHLLVGRMVMGTKYWYVESQDIQDTDHTLAWKADRLYLGKKDWSDWVGYHRVLRSRVVVERSPWAHCSHRQVRYHNKYAHRLRQE